MSGITLFDNLTETLSNAKATGEMTRRRAAMAEKLVAASLADLDRVREYEQVSYPADIATEPVSVALLKSIHGLYAEWLAEADQVASRAAELIKVNGVQLIDLPRLLDAIGSVRARLNMDPARLANSIEQARGGAFTPAKELRDELRARVRA